MPVNKNALLRYRIIDACLTNPMRKYPTMQQIIEKIETQLDDSISDSLFSKDIQQMKRIYGAPIKFNRFHNGYCYTEEAFSIKEFPLTHEEVAALDYSTALLHQLKGTRLFEQFENAINKVIEGYRISKILGKTETQIIQVEEPVKTGGSEYLEVILKAIVEKDVLEIAYQGYNKEEKLHCVSPYLIKEYRNRWYVVGFSNRTENVLVFALDRINNLKTCKEKYIPADGFSAEAFFNYSFGITQLHDDKPEKVVLSFTAFQAPYILGQPLHHSQQVLKQTDKELEVQLQVYITQELIMTILSYGKEVKVLKPASLQNKIKKMIKEMNEIYNKEEVDVGINN
jgi:predicted DNA-binding transcriptional regulator YafY